MWRVPLLQCKSDGPADRSLCSLGYHSVKRALPEAYMSDYSVIGLLVENHTEAVRVLKEHHFEMTPEMEILLDSPSQLPQVTALLSIAGVAWEIADTVGGVYQG